MPGLDPTPYTAWGVLGLLGIALIVMLGVVWKLITQQTANMKTRDELIMGFVDRHRGETTKAMADVAGTVAQSNDRLTVAFNRQSRALSEILLANRVLDRVESMRKAGVVLTQPEIDSIVRAAAHEMSSTREG